jgi:hypothetical protein
MDLLITESGGKQPDSGGGAPSVKAVRSSAPQTHFDARTSRTCAAGATLRWSAHFQSERVESNGDLAPQPGIDT